MRLNRAGLIVACLACVSSARADLNLTRPAWVESVHTAYHDPDSSGNTSRTSVSPAGAKFLVDNFHDPRVPLGGYLDSVIVDYQHAPTSITLAVTAANVFSEIASTSGVSLFVYS